MVPEMVPLAWAKAREPGRRSVAEVARGSARVAARASREERDRKWCKKPPKIVSVAFLWHFAFPSDEGSFMRIGKRDTVNEQR